MIILELALLSEKNEETASRTTPAMTERKPTTNSFKPTDCHRDTDTPLQTSKHKRNYKSENHQDDGKDQKCFHRFLIRSENYGNGSYN